MMTILQSIIAAGGGSGVPGPPGLPNGCEIQTPTVENELTLVWNAPTSGGPPTYYRVLLDDAEVFNGMPAPLQYTATGLLSNTLYDMKVHAGNGAGESGYVSDTETTLP